jgi:hypothetical protein
MPAGTDATTEAEACCTRVANGRIECAFRSEVPRGIEHLGVGIILGVVQDRPTKGFEYGCTQPKTRFTNQAFPMTMVPLGMI